MPDVREGMAWTLYSGTLVPWEGAKPRSRGLGGGALNLSQGARPEWYLERRVDSPREYRLGHGWVGRGMPRGLTCRMAGEAVWNMLQQPRGLKGWAEKGLCAKVKGEDMNGERQPSGAWRKG